MTYKAPNLPQHKHCFFGRKNGVSKGIYESLNFAFSGRDSAENLKKNLDIVAAHFNKTSDKLCHIINRAHTNKVIFVEAPTQREFIADGMVTKNHELLLGVTAADCLSVLLADYGNDIIGACHAGWKGAFTGVVQNTLDLMIEKGAQKESIIAALGPCMQKENFEVTSEFVEMFLAKDKSNTKYFTKKDDIHHLFDIEGYVYDILKNYGIKNISKSGIDTYSNEEEYFSYRRSENKGELDEQSGIPQQISIITF